MKYITVQKLDGIPAAYETMLAKMVRQMKGKEILAVVLFFMSDLEDGECTLRHIEANMRKVHIGKKSSNGEGEAYANYAASNIRGWFDKETQLVRQGKMREDDRLFYNIKTGYWRNSLLGNRFAKHVIGRDGYDVVISDRELSEDDKMELRIVEEAVRVVEGEERMALAKIRVNQGKFRKTLLNEQGVCKICGLDRADLLIASHIKPWADSTANEKLDPNNGFLLCPNHDALFDKQFISFEDDGRMIVSAALGESQRKAMGVDGDITIEVGNKNLPYLKHHRTLMSLKEKRRFSPR